MTKREKRKRLKKITADLLLDLKACGPAIAHFDKLFPKGARVTEANAGKAYRKGLELYWLAVRFFSGNELRYYVDVEDQLDDGYWDRKENLYERYYASKLSAEGIKKRLKQLEDRHAKAEGKLFVKFWEGRIRLPKAKAE